MTPPEGPREVSTLRRLHHLMSQVNARHDLQEVLQTVAEGVADVVGFEVAAISYLRSDGVLEVVAVAGDETARKELIGTRTPVSDIDAEFEMADEWGALRFVPHERLPGSVGAGWVSDVTPLDVPNAWHPQDALFAPLMSPTGELAGLLSVDLPYDGLRPGQFQREVLEMYSVQAGIAINNAWQRARLVEQVRLATATRAIVHTAGNALDLGRVIDDSVQPLVEGLRCHGLWIRAFEGDGERPGLGRGAIYPAGTTLEPPVGIMELARRVATDCWRGRRAVVVDGPDPTQTDLLTADEIKTMFEFVDQIGSRSVLFVPMGAGPECLGYLALTRTENDPAWSDEEADAALEIGRDLGRAVLHARLFARERQLVEELQALDHYKTELISTISHELRNPLTSIIGHLELLENVESPPGTVRSLAAITRNTERLEALVDDLLLLSKVGDPNRTLIPVQVDLAALLDETVEMCRVQADQRGVALRIVGTDGPVMAWGDPSELDCVAGNIVGNAIKYSASGGDVTVSVEATDDAVTFTCRDKGFGISATDQERLFAEFYRSSNPETQALPGTGLGLTIVKRIIDRHQGSISVESTLGLGSTFTVRLPTVPAR